MAKEHALVSSCVAARKVASLHAESLVHQDLKPAKTNFLIDDDNCPLLADFGTVASLDDWQIHFLPRVENESFSIVPYITGTKKYAATEVVHHEKFIDTLLI